MCSREVPGADVLPTGLVSVCVCVQVDGMMTLSRPKVLVSGDIKG